MTQAGFRVAVLRPQLKYLKLLLPPLFAATREVTCRAQQENDRYKCSLGPGLALVLADSLFFLFLSGILQCGVGRTPRRAP